MIGSLNELILCDVPLEMPSLEKIPVPESKFLYGLFHLETSFVYLLDQQKFEYVWVSDSVTNCIGYDKSAVTSKVMLDSVHPDDIQLLARYEREIHDFFEDNLLDRQNYEVAYLLRFRRRDGQYIPMLRQLFFCKSTEKKNYYYRIGIMSDLTDFYNDASDISSFFKILDLKSGQTFSLKKIEKHIECPLSKREKEVVYHINMGMSSREISQKLYLAYETVKTHRKIYIESSIVPTKCS